MIFVLIALWSIALILILSDPRSPAIRRLSGVAFTGGSGALAAVVDGQIIPYIAKVYTNAAAEQLLYMLQAAASLVSYYGLPYTVLLFSIAYRPVRWLTKYQTILPLLLFIPIALCLLFTPGYDEKYPISYLVVVWWAVPYLLLGAINVLMKSPGYTTQARKHWIVCFAVLPPVLFTMMMSYVLPSMGFLRMWVYNTWFVGIGVIVFFVGLFTYGFMGVRILIDRRKLDSTLRAVTSGTAILNHAIKNDVGKMRLFGEKMKAYAISTDQPELLADVETMLTTSRHIQEMINRVHQRTEDLVLRVKNVDMGQVIEETVKSFDLILSKAGVELKLSIVDGWSSRLDRAQVGEAMSNVISNAIEAMKDGGQLAVSMKETKQELIIEMKDNGPGMNKTQLLKAVEPFYTTKSGSDINFGLGLPYAYNVMRKHGGTLQMYSMLDEGTAVLMVFKKRMIRAKFISSAASSLAVPDKAKETEAHG
ncbi:MAG: sensor histidine kinase [Candidatus Pristimantibacillus sp.]